MLSNLIIKGVYKCPSCSGKRWKIENNAVYCIAQKENGNPCCWHLNPAQAERFKKFVKEKLINNQRLKCQN